MKQILQNIKNGKRSIVTIPDPLAKAGQVLIVNAASLISAGTEKMVIELAKKNLLSKARERPDHVRRVLEKVRNEGLFETLRQVQSKLEEPMSLGYSSSGVVLACGTGVSEFKPGDRVASNGPHAEVVSVPRHLVARVPDNVSHEEAAFTVVSSIALQGVRLANPEIGETVLVVGLGLVGQIVVSLLDACGIRVIGTDPDVSKCALAVQMGAASASPGLTAEEVGAFTGGRGADKVMLTASTKSNQPIQLAADAVRKKGRIVLVGVVGLELDRRPFYFKEAEFVVSCSYGPGRYDAAYEEGGHDYPYQFVRFTEQRNMQTVLDLMGAGKIDLKPLISHRFAVEDAEKAYQIIEDGEEPYLGMILNYARHESVHRVVVGASKPSAAGCAEQRVGVGLLGAGNFARAVLIPAIRLESELRLHTVCSAGGVSAVSTAQKTGFEVAVADEEEVFGSPEIGAIFVLTRHDEHARQVIRAMRAGKHVFTEKPLCVTIEELAEIEKTISGMGDDAPLVTVGFNRRFSPAAKAVKAFFSSVRTPLTLSFRVNAGKIPPEHWTQDGEVGGGRLIGEACHAIDLATYLLGSKPVRVYAESVGGASAPQVTDDQCFITLRHENGSVSQVAYLSGGDRSFPKERVEALGGGQVAVIDDFKSWTLTRNGRTAKFGGKMDKGHRAEISAFVVALRERTAPIPWEELRAVTLASILAVRSIREGVPFDLEC